MGGLVVSTCPAHVTVRAGGELRDQPAVGPPV